MSETDPNHLSSRSKKITSGSAELDAKIKEWLNWDKNRKTSDQVKNLVRAGEFDQLREMMTTRLRYGLEGFKGPMRAGYNAINDLFIIQCAQGILKYMEANEGQKLKTAGIVVGFDGRRNSKRFSELVATVFIQQHYVVRMYTVVVPAYFVAYAIVKYYAACGIMISSGVGTSKESGLKIYNSYGAPVAYPVENEIENSIQESLEPYNSSWETSILEKADIKINPLADVLKSFLDMILDEVIPQYRDINKKVSTQFVYTPLHGVGFIYMARAMDIINLQLIPVEEEKYPNPDFPDEDVPDFRGNITLDSAMHVAQNHKASHIIANNPDCTRVVVAERNPKTEEFKFFNADEMAVLLAWWAYHIFQDKLPADKKTTDIQMIGGVFNTKLTKQMARIDGFYFTETLNGGKWLGHTMKKFVDLGKLVIFGYDDYGFIVNMSPCAKDGIQAGIHLATFINYLAFHKITLKEQLEELYKQYGFYTSIKCCFTTENQNTMYQLINKLRTYRGVYGYPKGMAGGKYPIKYIRDLQLGLDTAEENKRTTLPQDPNVDLLGFTFDNRMIASIYHNKLMPQALTLHTSITGPGETILQQSELKMLLTKMTYIFMEEFIEPKLNEMVIQGMEIPGVQAPTTDKCH